MAKSMSGFFLAAARGSSLSRKPTVTITLHSASTIDWMLPAKSEAFFDSTWPVGMPSSDAASAMPLYEVSLNDLSSNPPESETMQALNPALLALALPLVLALGAAEEPPVPGAWAQAARVRTTAALSAGPQNRDFFTGASWA